MKGLALPAAWECMVGADTVGTFRITVAGQPDHLASGSQGIDFILRNTDTDERTVYHSLFMGPQ